MKCHCENTSLRIQHRPELSFVSPSDSEGSPPFLLFKAISMGAKNSPLRVIQRAKPEGSPSLEKQRRFLTPLCFVRNDSSKDLPRNDSPIHCHSEFLYCYPELSFVTPSVSEGSPPLEARRFLVAYAPRNDREESCGIKVKASELNKMKPRNDKKRLLG